MTNKPIASIDLRLGDCLEVLKSLPENSIHAIVTDPPYELGFMGKSWDNTGIANNKLMWAEALRVLKPGGHLLAFSGTRTYHRMACAIEDAGFEVRDMIEWVYGCLSEDTEILTESGYKPLRKLTQYDRIGIYDITSNIYKWERPQRYSVYKVHQDTAYRIKSDYTDQIVSRNHRCLVEREGKLVFITAEELNEVEYMPTLSDDFYSLQENSNRKLLLKELLWKGKGLAQTVFSKWKGKEVSEQRIEVRKEPSLERWSNLLEETRKLQADKICEVSEGVFTDGEKRWICNGTSFDSGSIIGDMFRESSSHTSYQSRPTGQPTGKPDVISIKQGTQIIRRATITKIEYSGIIFCPTVSTGAFVARRNGQVFITGNSGFPKSLNIGKAVDKLGQNPYGWIEFSKAYKKIVEESKYNHNDIDNHLGIKASSCYWARTDHRGGLPPRHHWEKVKQFIGLDSRYDELYDEVEREVIGKAIRSTAGFSNEQVPRPWKAKVGEEMNLTKGTSEYEGWGTALKPAHEPICMARKPLSEKTVAENCLKWGTGGINIDGSRVGTEVITQNQYDRTPEHGNQYGNGAERKQNGIQTQTIGRFPANLIHDNSEEVRECFPETKSVKGKPRQVKNIGSFGGGTTNGDNEYNDSGNASRFFKSIIYVPKSSKSERNKGLDNYLLVKYNIDTLQGGAIWKEENTELVELLKRVIYGLGLKSFSIVISGEGIMVLCRRDILSIIKTEISKITELKILNLLTHLPTSEYIADANCEMVSGGSRAISAESLKELIKRIGISVKKDGFNTEDAVNVIYTLLLKISNEENWKNATNFHPTCKPIALMSYLIKMVTREGQVVLDPFMGSGTTGVACKELGREFIGIELSSEYMEIAKRRINNTQRSLL